MGYIDKASVGGTEYDIHDERIPDGMEVAYVDGYYEQMTVGNAEQLVATVGIEDKVPYNFRTSGGSADIGDRVQEKIIGGTIAWNQLTNDGYVSLGTTGQGSSLTTQGVTFAVNSDGSISISGQQEARAYVYNTSVAHQSKLCRPNDVILMTGFGTSNFPIKFGFSFYNGTTWVEGGTTFNLNAKDGVVLKAPQTADRYSAVSIDSPAENNTKTLDAKVTANVFNLTQMFGSTIADYVYSLETSHAGDGVAWFRKLFPKPYYAYNAGELMSVQAASHKMTGFNQWDEEWENGYFSSQGAASASTTAVRSKYYCLCLPSTTYYNYIGNSSSTLFILWYDANKTFISRVSDKNHTITSPSNAYYFKLCSDTNYGTTYNNDICINLHWDGERDGEYEPYSLRTYVLDSDLVLRGIPKLDANNALYYDGDTYESDGTVTRRYANVNLGSLTWSYQNESLNAVINGETAPAWTRAGANWAICSKYQIESWNSIDNNTYTDKSLHALLYNGNLNIRVYDSSYTDAETFKTAMNGVYLVLETSNVTTETADPYQNPQIVDDWGTEEYVDAAATAATSPRDVSIPVGHDSMYRNNLRAKLEMAPESPDGDGDYIVRQSNGENVYVPITFPADELPAAPTTDGDYVLKCTVSSGTATFTWDNA